MVSVKEKDIVKGGTFVDEFEMQQETVCEVKEEPAPIVEEVRNVEMDKTIHENFDKILHYDTYSMQQEIKEREHVYNKFVNNYNSDLSPSSTTMQFRNLSKSEIYQDVREETAPVESVTKLRPKTKLMVACLSIATVVFSAFVVFNTALLNNMNKVIEQKYSQIEELTDKKASLYEELNEVSSDENVIKSAKELGMVE